MKRQILATLGLLSGTAVMPATPLWAQDAPSQAAEEPQQLGSGYGTASDIVVTARRRDERLQDVPVSVSAFSAAALERSTVQTVQDINTITPGFRAGAEGGKE